MSSELSASYGDSNVLQKDSDQTQAPPAKFAKVRIYEPKGKLRLHRLSSSTPFICGRCNNEKKAKLVATYCDRWDDLRCNACYGKLLSEI
jgi:hypothetical protein